MVKTRWVLVPNDRDVLIWRCLNAPELHYLSGRRQFWSTAYSLPPCLQVAR